MPFYVATRMTRFSETLSKTSFFIPDAVSFARSAVRLLGYSPRTSGYFSHVLQVSWCFWFLLCCFLLFFFLNSFL
jgi:hypothetical protein